MSNVWPHTRISFEMSACAAALRLVWKLMDLERRGTHWAARGCNGHEYSVLHQACDPPRDFTVR